jgi:hypothetical protein
MKRLFQKTFLAIMTMLCVFILGILPGTIVSLIIVIATNASMEECVATSPFIVFTIIGTIISCVYIAETVFKD